MRYLGIFITLLLLISSCSTSNNEEANKLLQSAQELTNNKNYSEALIIIDSITNNFPKEIEATKKAQHLIISIKSSQLQENRIFLVNLLCEKEKELKKLMKNFIISDEYGTEKKLIHKRQRPKNSYNRTYIQANLNMKGDFYISSRYTGDKWINHNQIKVYNNDQQVTSLVVKKDGFLNRQFEDGDVKWETVKYKNGADNGIIDFIATNWNKPLKVQYIGKGYFYIVMEKFDKEAIRDGYEISFVIKEIEKIKQEIQNNKITQKSLQKSVKKR